MMRLYDPITGEALEVYGMRVTADEIYRSDAEPVVRNLSLEYNVDEEEMKRRLQNSDIDHPIVYRDEVFWVEPK